MKTQKPGTRTERQATEGRRGGETGREGGREGDVSACREKKEVSEDTGDFF